MRHGGVPPYQETRTYVTSILTAYNGGVEPVLSGGFGKPRKTARPVTVWNDGGRPMISNVKRSGEAALDRKLGLR